MRLTPWLIFAPLISSVSAAGDRVKYDLGFIFEYEDWALQNNPDLVAAVKATLNNISTIDEVVVTPRIEFSSSIFRGISANISGVGSNVTPDFLRGALQSLDVVKAVTPIEVSNPRSSIARRQTGTASDDSPSLTSRGLSGSNEKRQIDFVQSAVSTHIMCGVDKLHAEDIKGKGIRIAILDDGFDYKQDVFGNSIGPGNKIIYGHDWVGDNYLTDDPTTGVQGPAVEDNDPYTSCSSHGTHVFGIVGANPTEFGIVGTAPEASYELHRVAGCELSVGTDVFMKAAIGAYERGVDIITNSDGFTLSYPDEALSSVVSRINQNGTYFQVSAGNSGSQLYTGTGAAAGLDVTAIGAVWNTETPFYTWGGSFTTKGKSTPFRVGVSDSMVFPSPNFNIWTASSQASDFINTGCLPYPADLKLPNFNTTVVLLNQPPGGVCDIYNASTTLGAAGVRYVLFYFTTPDDAVRGTEFIFGYGGIKAIARIDPTQGAALFAAYQQDKSLTVSVESPSAHNGTTTWLYNNVNGGRMTGFSGWGPTPDGRTYPTFSAPGGQTLSIFPEKDGSFGINYGTSMAAPYAAGVAALVKSQHPEWHALQIRNVLSTTANPMPYNDYSAKAYGYLAPVFQQGGGLVDAYRAAHTTTIVDTPSLSFNDSTHSPFQPKTLSFKVKNIGQKAQVFKAYHIGAVSGYGIASDPYSGAGEDDLIKSFVTSYASVSISPSSFTIAAGSETTISVTVKALPSGLDPKRLPFYGGYISLNSTDATQTVTVPYTGIATNLKTSIGIDLSQTVLQSWDSSTSKSIAPPAGQPPVFNITYQGPGKSFADGIWPAITYVFNSAAVIHYFDIAILKPNGDVFLTVERSNIYSGSDGWYLDGVDGNYTFIPAGEYQWRVRVLKIYGDKNNPDDWLSLTTDKFVMQYTKDSVGLPKQ